MSAPMNAELGPSDTGHSALTWNLKHKIQQKWIKALHYINGQRVSPYSICPTKVHTKYIYYIRICVYCIIDVYIIKFGVIGRKKIPLHIHFYLTILEFFPNEHIYKNTTILETAYFLLWFVTERRDWNGKLSNKINQLKKIERKEQKETMNSIQTLNIYSFKNLG